MTESEERREAEGRDAGEEVAAEPDSDVVERETERAAREAASIGGDPGMPPVDDEGRSADEAERPLAEAGEGVSEGFEQAEAELEESAEHGVDRPADLEAPETEKEDDRAAHGEADRARGQPD